MTLPVVSIDPLIAKFKAQNFAIGIAHGRGSWKTKAKTWLNTYTMAAEIYTRGVPDAARIDQVQGWLDEQYKAIDALDTSQPGWKAAAVVRLGASLKTFAEFHRRLWEAAKRLFEGGADPNFIGTFARSIDVELTKAWNEGGKALGIEPEEMTEKDHEILAGIISNENEYILGLADDILEARTSGMEAEAFERQFGARVNTWANRYTDVVNQAMLYFGAKERLVWRLGQREEHCDTCSRLNGIVAFGEEWSKVGLHPQQPPNDKLECGGWECGCGLHPTKQRRTRNAIKKLRAIAGGAA